MLWGTGTRVVDLVDRLRAGDSIEDVAQDFTADEADLELLVHLADALALPASVSAAQEGQER